MKHISAIIIKFAIIATVLQVILGMMTNLSFIDILIISAVVTALAYFLGDIIMLDISSNTVATVSDIALSFVTIYMFNYWWAYKSISFTTALASALVIGAGEWFFHKYVDRNVLPQEEQ